MIPSHTPSPPGLARFLLAAIVFAFGSLAALSFAYSSTNTTVERRALSVDSDALTTEPPAQTVRPRDYHEERVFETSNISYTVPKTISNFISGPVTLLETKVVDDSKSGTPPIDLATVESSGNLSIFSTDLSSLTVTNQPGSTGSEVAALVEKLSGLLNDVDPLPAPSIIHDAATKAEAMATEILSKASQLQALETVVGWIEDLDSMTESIVQDTTTSSMPKLPISTLDEHSRAATSGIKGMAPAVVDEGSMAIEASVTTLFPIPISPPAATPTPPTVTPPTVSNPNSPPITGTPNGASSGPPASDSPNSHPSLTGSIRTGEDTSRTVATSGMSDI